MNATIHYYLSVAILKILDYLFLSKVTLLLDIACVLVVSTVRSVLVKIFLVVQRVHSVTNLVYKQTPSVNNAQVSSYTTYRFEPNLCKLLIQH